MCLSGLVLVDPVVGLGVGQQGITWAPPSWNHLSELPKAHFVTQFNIVYVVLLDDLSLVSAIPTAGRITEMTLRNCHVEGCNISWKIRHTWHLTHSGK